MPKTASKLPKITEKEFMAQVVEFAKLRGWKTYHTLVSRGSEAGFPDLVMVRGQRLWFVELKTEGKKLTHAQHNWIRAILATGALAVVWRPDDWPEIERILM